MAITLVHDCDVERRPSPTALNGDFRDCDINEQLPDTTHDYTQLNSGVYVPGGKGSRYQRRALFWYDLKAFIPANATITAARFWFYVVSNNSTGSHSFQLIRIRRNDEGSGNHWKENEATWNNYKSGTAWSTAGAAHVTDDRDTSKFKTLGAITTTGWKNYDVLSLASDAWSNHNGICTFILERYDAYMTVDGHIAIHAKNYQPYDNGAYPHHLRITYTLEGRTFQVMVR